MNLKQFIPLLLLILLNPPAVAQDYFRISGNYSIKARSSEGKTQLTAGRFYYDKNFKKLVYRNSFPSPETWVSFDTVVCKVVDNKIMQRYSVPPLAQFSIFHLVLTGQIRNYGLKNSGFTVKSVEKSNDMVITTWLPPKNISKMFGKVLISVKNNRLNGLVFIDAKGTILRKQFFDKYKNFGGIEFPLEIVDITYLQGKENYQVTTYKDIIFDEALSNQYYNFAIPD
jgi:hypothetical protein